MTATDALPSWRETCASCGAYYAPYCYGIELMAGSDRELEHPYKTEPDEWCALWRREPKTEWNGKPCGRRRVSMSATDELRALLDDAGVEWSATTGAADTIWTHWNALNGHRVHAMDNGDGTVEIFGELDVTPAQAIEATLGRGECHDVGNLIDGGNEFCCSECGCVLQLYDDDGCNNLCTSFIFDYPRYCPECGRRVVEVGE